MRPVFAAGITQPWHSGLLVFLKYFTARHPSCSREQGRAEELGEFPQGVLV